jgi:hypothetical protein
MTEHGCATVHPAGDASVASLERYLRRCSVGDLIVIRAGWGFSVSYTLAKIARVNPKTGRVYTDRPGRMGSPGAAFYMTSGRNYDHPKGQTWLLEPTEDNINLAETGLRGAHYCGPKVPDE